MKADRTMSRMMKLRIALGNAILPNVPQAMDILFSKWVNHDSTHMSHQKRRFKRRSWLSDKSHKRSSIENKEQSNMLNNKDRAQKLEILKKNNAKGNSSNRIKLV